MVTKNTTVAMEADGERRAVCKDAVQPVAQSDGSCERLVDVVELERNERVVVVPMVDH